MAPYSNVETVVIYINYHKTPRLNKVSERWHANCKIYCKKSLDTCNLCTLGLVHNLFKDNIMAEFVGKTRDSSQKSNKFGWEIVKLNNLCLAEYFFLNNVPDLCSRLKLPMPVYFTILTTNQRYNGKKKSYFCIICSHHDIIIENLI